MSIGLDGAAFPVVHPDGKGVQYYGLSIRDYFAAKAMESMIARYGYARGQADQLAQNAYDCADAMLKERTK